MLVRYLDTPANSECESWDFENAKFIAAENISNYKEFLEMIDFMCDNDEYKTENQVKDKHIFIEDNWFDVLDYEYSPGTGSNTSCINVYLAGY